MFKRSEISFQHPLATLSMPLAEADRSLKNPAPKSVSLHKLEKDVELVRQYLKDSA